MRPTRIGQPPPEPSKPLRPNHWVSILLSVCAANRTSTQPVSRLVAVPLPHASSVPLNVVLFAASWQLTLVSVGSFREYVEPTCVVFSVTGPFQALEPVPRMTCSCVWSTLPVVASTTTSSLLGPSALRPTTVLCHASAGVPSA